MPRALRYPIQPRRFSPVSGGGGLVSKSNADTGTGADLGSVLAVTQSADTAAGVDAGSVFITVYITDADTGSGIDTGSVLAATQSADTGSAIDAGVLLPSIVDVDSCSSTETGSVLAAAQSVDTGSGVDTEMLLVSLVDADIGTSTDTSAVSVLDGDTGVGVDVSVSVGVVDGDVVSSVDSASVAVALSGQDTVSSAEFSSITVIAEDTGQGAEAVSQLSVTLSGSDSVQSVDLAAIGITPASAGEEFGVESETTVIEATSSSVDSATVIEAASLEITEVDSVTAIELATVLPLFINEDTGISAESAVLAAFVQASDSVAGVETSLIGAVTASTEVGAVTDQQSLVAAITETDSGGLVDGQSLAVSSLSAESVSCFESSQIIATQLDADTVHVSETASVLKTQDIHDSDEAAFEETASPSLAPLPLSVFELESPSVVEVLRYTTTRVNGSLAVQWVPVSQLIHGHLFGLSPRRPFDEPLAGGQVAVRFDLHYVRPGATQPAPPQSGFMVDRYGVMFADPSAAGLLKAGDRVRCISGPIDGMFEIRVTPDLPAGFDAVHHLEVEVVEVSQKWSSGSYFSPSLDPSTFISQMRDLYDTRVKVLRRQVDSDLAGSARESWVQITDVPDFFLGVPGEMLCRLSLGPLRRGKDQLPPLEAGRAPDRVGVLYCDVTPHLRAGDRLQCVSGPVTGMFELRVAPDLSPDFSSVHHLEVQVIEVSQHPSLGSVYDPMIDPSSLFSYMRDLYDTRVEVLRRDTVSTEGGSVREAWQKISDVPDAVLGVPGEMLCRLSIGLLRPGKDQPPPLVAGRAPDRVGVLYCDATRNLHAGDRVRCLSGPVTGTFEVRVMPDLDSDFSSIHHLEVQVIETSQQLAGIFPRTEVVT